MVFHQHFLPSRFVDILVTHVLHFHWGGGGVFRLQAMLICNVTRPLQTKKSLEKNKMRLSKSSPALYALKGKHVQCVDSE